MLSAEDAGEAAEEEAGGAWVLTEATEAGEAADAGEASDDTQDYGEVIEPAKDHADADTAALRLVGLSLVSRPAPPAKGAAYARLAAYGLLAKPPPGW